MSYAEAKARYAAIGVDTEAAIARLKTVPISLHCWQGDDVRGFDTDPTKPLTGRIQTTGNYPGRARTPEELMADMDKVLSLCPGTKKINLHASYAIFDEENPWVDRDKLEPKHFKKWVDFCKARGLGADFNPTFFSHPKCDPLTLASPNEETRTMCMWSCPTSWASTPLIWKMPSAHRKTTSALPTCGSSLPRITSTFLWTAR